MKKLSIFGQSILVFLILSMFLYGCSEGEPLVTDDSTVQLQSDETVRFLYSDWPPDLIAYLAQEKGFFEENQANVELIKVSGYDELLEKKASQEIPYVWSFTLLDALKEQATGEEADGQVLLVEDYSAGADAVLAAPDSGISAVIDLAGKKVGLEEETVGEFFLNILLSRENMSFDDFEVVSLTSEEVPEALVSGQIDAGVAYEPDVSNALEMGATLITDSSQERGVIVDVYVGKHSHIQENKENYERFAQSIFEAADYYNQHPDESIDIMSKAFDMDPDELRQTFETLQIATLRDNQTAFNRSSGFSSLYNLAKQAEQFLQDQGVVTMPLDYDALFGDNVVDNL